MAPAAGPRRGAGRGDGDGHSRRVPLLVSDRPEPSPGLPAGDDRVANGAHWLGPLGPPDVLVRWLVLRTGPGG